MAIAVVAECVDEEEEEEVTLVLVDIGTIRFI